MAQNLYLVAEAAGLGACMVGAFLDGMLNDLLRINGRREAALGLVAVGPVDASVRESCPASDQATGRPGQDQVLAVLAVAAICRMPTLVPGCATGAMAPDTARRASELAFDLEMPRPAVNLLYRFATRPCRQSWNTDAMTRRPVPAQQEQPQDQVKNASVRSGARARRVAPIYGLDVDAVTADDRDAVRQAGAGDARRPRAVAGLPERIEDPAVAALLAGLLREPGPAGVVRSGRCPACGYLYGSGGHQVSCELPASRTGERAYITVVRVITRCITPVDVGTRRYHPGHARGPRTNAPRVSPRRARRGPAVLAAELLGRVRAELPVIGVLR